MFKGENTHLSFKLRLFLRDFQSYFKGENEYSSWRKLWNTIRKSFFYNQLKEKDFDGHTDFKSMVSV